MTRSRFLAVAGAAALLLLPPAAGAQSRPFRFDEMAKAGRLSGFSLSRDGKWIAYAVSVPDVDENRGRSAIWLLAAGGGEPRRLTSGPRDAEPKFSPDRKRLAFLSAREGGSQMWLLDLAGGDPVKATSFPTEVNGYEWSPDGKWFLVTSDVFPECADAACLDKKLKAREKSTIRARIVEGLLFRHWDLWKDGTHTHVWKLAVDGSAAVDLTPGDSDAPPFAVGGGSDYDVAPDGRDFVFASNHDPIGAVSTNADLWLGSFDGTTAVKSLTAGNPAWDGSPKFSPDGKWLAWRAQKRPGFEADRFRLMVLDRSTGKTRGLTEDFDQWVEEYLWAPDSRSIDFVSHVSGRGAIFRVDIAGGPPAEVWRGGSAGNLRFSPDGRRLYFVSSTLSRAPEIWSAGSDGKGAAPLTHINDRLCGETAMGDVSERWTSSADGKKLHAWVVKPPTFDPAKKYPAVFLIHGGPQGAWNDGWSTRWNPQVWAAYGYVVYAANPRGSTGFGQEFLDQISGDWGGKVYDDLMRQADDLEALPYVDKTRIGAAGASYGGYMVNWIAGHTERFKCLVSHDGLFDTNSAGLETEELWFPAWEFGGWPWNSPLYEKWNPMRFADKFRTPTLVVTSERDYRVPFGQGLQFFSALQIQKVPSKLLMFPDEGHWVLKPGNSRLWHAVVMDWLHRWLGGTEADPKALETAYSVAR
ncbi:MAG TPA: S9 family peptidase [Thermoanaerobaculia bacterium]|nr:S9 family peptidase [Thermoanaerobaculia bacterium]